jgi:hypothetical protein
MSLCPLYASHCMCSLLIFTPAFWAVHHIKWTFIFWVSLHFQAFRGPDFLGTVCLNSPVFRDHVHGPRIFHHKTVSNLHALTIFSHSPFHVTSFVHIVIVKNTVHTNSFVTDAYSHCFLWAKILAERNLLEWYISGSSWLQRTRASCTCTYFSYIFTLYSLVSLQKHM